MNCKSLVFTTIFIIIIIFIIIFVFLEKARSLITLVGCAYNEKMDIFEMN